VHKKAIKLTNTKVVKMSAIEIRAVSEFVCPQIYSTRKRKIQGKFIKDENINSITVIHVP
jgi:hypothetical protein